MRARRFKAEDAEITQKLDLALERLRDASARQHRAREHLASVRPPSSDEELDLDRALDAGTSTQP